MAIYIDAQKFQFITDYSKHIYKNITGKEFIIDFGNLSIYQRIMLSAYLTILCEDKNAVLKYQNIYDKIFNFNYEKQYVQRIYYTDFVNDLIKFMKEFQSYFNFIKDNFDKIENDKTFIFRSQLNSSEMSFLYSLQFRRSYKSLMNVLYIIGVSKQNIQTIKLNKIFLRNFYNNSLSMSKKRIIKIFEKINQRSNHKVKYKIDGEYVYFSSGFEIKQDEKFYSEEKIKFNNSKREEEILNSFLEKN